MGFRNPILGGGGSVLLRPAIQSPNFQHLVRGWQIARSGNAEFNDLSLRGTFVGTDYVINESGIFLYSGTPAAGNLIGSWVSAAGTDDFGNAYEAGLTLYAPGQGTVNLSIDPGGAMLAEWLDAVGGSQVNIAAGGGAAGMTFTPPTTGGAAWTQGSINAIVSNVFGTNTAELAISGPYNNAHPSHPTIALFGSSDTNASNRVDLTTQQVNASGDLTVGGAATKAAETWQTPSYNANWSSTTTYGSIAGGLGALKYRRDAEDNVQLIGTFTAATGATASVFNLPAAYRPKANWPFPVAFISSGGVAGNAWAYVSTAGNLNINSQLGSSVTAGTTYTVNTKMPLGNIS
jgi:hypothetical protein